MIPLKRALSSSIGRKFVMSLSGIGLVVFVIVHLLGNLTLLIPDGGVAFNKYAYNFEALGPALYVIELGLLAVIAIHIVFGVTVSLKNRAARAKGYDANIQTKGGPSRLSAASRNMFITGGFLGAFIVAHLLHFRVAKEFVGEKIMVDGTEMTDLYSMVVDAFANPIIVAIYVAAAVVLGFHLRHGFWSAFQSLGTMKPEWSNAIYSVGYAIAFALAVGFVGIPVYLFAIQLGG